MKVSFENPDKINGRLTLVVEEEDYKNEVEKTLKDYRKKANVPGFRPGQAPMGMIKRQFGPSVKMEAINKIVGQEIYKYVQENKIQMLGEPLPSEKQEPADLENGTTFTFMFDIAVAPEFKVTLNGRDKVDYYNIKVDDKILDQQVEMYAQRAGSYEKGEKYEENDLLKGDIRELDENGNTKEGGITVEAAVMMPSYIKVEEQKNLFNDAKVGDIITFNPKKAYPDNDTEVAQLLKIERDSVKDLESEFSYQITEIQRFKKHEVNEELFKLALGEDTDVKDEAAFRAKIAEGLQAQLVGDSDYKFLLDVRAHCEKKVGKLEFPDALLKRIMLANNKDKGEDFVEKNYEESLKELTWHLIKEQLIKAQDIKINDEDVKETAKEAARAQFAQYGMANIPEEYVENYANEILKKGNSTEALVDRAIDRKLATTLKTVVKLNEKEISVEDFNKMMQE